VTHIVNALKKRSRPGTTLFAAIELHPSIVTVRLALRTERLNYSKECSTQNNAITAISSFNFFFNSYAKSTEFQYRKNPSIWILCPNVFQKLNVYFNFEITTEFSCGEKKL